MGANAASKTAGTIVKVGAIAAIVIWSISFLCFLIIGMVGANEERKMMRAIQKEERKMMREINSAIDAARSIQYDL